MWVAGWLRDEPLDQEIFYKNEESVGLDRAVASAVQHVEAPQRVGAPARPPGPCCGHLLPGFNSPARELQHRRRTTTGGESDAHLEGAVVSRQSSEKTNAGQYVMVSRLRTRPFNPARRSSNIPFAIHLTKFIGSNHSIVTTELYQ